MALARLFDRWRGRLGVAAAAVALALSAFAFTGSAPAQTAPSGWSLCNQTSFVLQAAVGRPVSRAIAVQGWTRLRPGECRVVAPAPLTRGVYYLYARSSPAHRGGQRQWGGRDILCVDPQNTFSIENPARCETMGLEERQFRQVKINKRESWRSNLAEAEEYSLPRARTAGLQRLLADAGLDARANDPRKIAAALTNFKLQARLAPNASEEQIIDALEERARTRAESVGLRLCNGSSSKMWTAIARRRSEGWESRGWWALGPSGCARVIDEALVQSVYFIHAVLESPSGDRLLAQPGETFCTAQTRFAVVGRENCEKRLYDEKVFVPVRPRDGLEGLQVTLSEREFLPPGVQPQRIEMQMAADVAPDADTGRAPRGRAPAAATPERRAGPVAGPEPET